MAIDRDKQNKRQNQWKRDNQDKVTLMVPKGTKDAWKAQAEAEGTNLTQWIIKKCQGD